MTLKKAFFYIMVVCCVQTAMLAQPKLETVLYERWQPGVWGEVTNGWQLAIHVNGGPFHARDEIDIWLALKNTTESEMPLIERNAAQTFQVHISRDNQDVPLKGQGDKFQQLFAMAGSVFR